LRREVLSSSVLGWTPSPAGTIAQPKDWSQFLQTSLFRIEKQHLWIYSIFFPGYGVGLMKLVFLGPPGAGKGTVAEKAEKDLAVPHVSTGEIFRAAIKNETPLGKRVKAIIESGGLVPDELTIELVRERVGKPDAAKGWILDGFPRTIPQADALEGFAPADKVVEFGLEDAAIIERLSGRRTCASCGKSFHVKFMPPKKEGVCDACGGKLEIRPDDRIESIKKRLEAYRAQTAPLIDYYRKKGKLVVVDASPAADVVYKGFQKVLGQKKK
jgi:adenylate kinase